MRLHATAARRDRWSIRRSRPPVTRVDLAKHWPSRRQRRVRLPLGRARPLLCDRTDVLVLGGLGAAALLIRAVPVLRGGGLFGLHGYDDGVYFATASALVHGVVPYRDILLLHPPGMILALVPFAGLGEWIGQPGAFATARLAIMALGVLNTVLVALVAGRYGRLAGLVSAALYAAWNLSANSERTTDLHGPQSTLVLVSLLVLARPGRIGVRRAALAGIPLGIAASVQLWQGVTILVVLWWVLVRARGHGWARLAPPTALAIGAGAALAVICLPFFLAAPVAMFDHIVLDQIGRPTASVDLLDRLRVLEGFTRLRQLPPGLRWLLPAPVVLAVAVTGVAIALVAAWRRPWTRLWAVLVLTQGALVLVTPSFFNDYVSFAAPAASLVIGSGLAASVIVLRDRGVRPAIAAAPTLAVILVAAIASAGHREGLPLPLEGLERDLSTARCVSADSPALLALTPALDRNLHTGCDLLVDPTGISLGNRRRLAAHYQQAMVDWYTSGDAAMFVRPASDALTEATMEAIACALPFTSRYGDVVVRFARPPNAP